MQFNTKTHPHYYGVDLNTKTIHVRFLDPSGYIPIHPNMRTDPDRLWSFTAPPGGRPGGRRSDLRSANFIDRADMTFARMVILGKSSAQRISDSECLR